MFSRLVSAILVAVLGLTLLAWPLGRIGVHSVGETGNLRTLVALSERALLIRFESPVSRRALDRDRYSVAFGTPPPGQPRTQMVQIGQTGQFVRQQVGQPVLQATERSRWFRPRLTRAAGIAVLSLPLPMLLAASLSLFLLFPVARILRTRRRGRRHLCLACGYQRTEDSGICTECGATPDAAAASVRARPGRLIRDAGVVLFVMLLGLSGFTWVTVERDKRAQERHQAQILNYGWYVGATQPQLTGKVLVARPDPGPGNLSSVLRAAGPGTIIFLLPGEHTLGDRRQRLSRSEISLLEDIWLLGAGPETTTLNLIIEEAPRLRIEGVTIDCRDDPFADLRNGGELQLHRCRVRGYNSGAGGSNSMYGSSTTVLLIEDCEFEGSSGRGAGRGSGGTALDLRGSSRIFVRNTAFVGNSEIVRSTTGVFDNCKASAADSRFFSPPGGTGVYWRNSDFPSMRTTRAGTQVGELLDDPAVLDRLTSRRAFRSGEWADPEVADAAAAIKPWRSAAFWENLRIHPSPEVRAIAASHGVPSSVTLAEIPLNEALQKLGEQFVPPPVTVSLLRNAEQARPVLEQMVSAGLQRERENAAAILHLMDIEPPVLEMLEYSARRGE